MKFLHVADLHIGKVVNEFSMLEDQKIILDQILETATEQKVEAVLIAGDIYDRSVPPADAVAVFDHFLTRATERKLAVVMIAGNHDSQERISFLKEPLHRQGIHIAGVMEEELTTVRFCEEGSTGRVTEVVLLPFGKPAQRQCRTSSELVQSMLSGYWEKEKVRGEQEKNRILLTHFFVTDRGRAPELSDSETTLYVGSLDDVEVSLFEGFDYVALGHLHKKQQIGDYPVWYAGAPLKYSFGEVSDQKVMLLVTMDENGLHEVKELPLTPQHDMQSLTGTLKELLERGRDMGEAAGDYIRACLTDEGELIDPMETLRSVYPNLMQIVRKDRAGVETAFALNSLTKGRTLAEKKDAAALFEEFYREISDEELTEEQKRLMQRVIREVKEKGV